MAIRCLRSYRDNCDMPFEIVVSEDGGMFSPTLMSEADVYIYNKKNGGFSKNVNTVWKAGKGDYVAIINSDTYYVSGSFKALCEENRVISPEIINQEIDGFSGCFWVAHKSIPEGYGYLDEDMRIYYSDEVYKQKLGQVAYKTPDFSIFHGQAKTVTTAGVNTPEQYKIDKEVYDSKG